MISNVDRWIAFEWIVDQLSSTYNLEFILLNPGNSFLEKHLVEKGIPTVRIEYVGKLSLAKAVYKVWKILNSNKPEIVHCHFIDASLVGLIVARIANVKNRIHTRHHSVYHHKYFPKGVYYDRLINLLSTKIIAISGVVNNVLNKKENVKESKIIEINHGFDLSLFEGDSMNVDLKTQFDENKPIIGVISRYIDLKGIIYVIEAFKMLLKDNPKALLLLLNARGPQQDDIKKRLEDIPLTNFKEIPFTPYICDYYKIMDIYVHTPIDPEVEAFGQTYVEALAAGVPSIFTISGIANDFIEDRKNALVVPYKDSGAIYNALKELINNSELRQQLVRAGKEDVNLRFGLENMIKQLDQCYSA